MSETAAGTASNPASNGADEPLEENSIADLPKRWEVELEFVQSLANTQYLSYLVQQGYLKSPEFLNYIKYLQYWKSNKYSKLLVYPDCLHILTLLQIEQFRIDITNQNLTNALFIDMVDYWKEEIYKEESAARKMAEDAADALKRQSTTAPTSGITPGQSLGTGDGDIRMGGVDDFETPQPLSVPRTTASNLAKTMSMSPTSTEG